MIQDRIRTFRDNIDEDDIYDDSLRKLQDSLENLAQLEDSREVAEVLQEMLLTRQFLRKLVYKEVEDNAKERLRIMAARDSESDNSDTVELSPDGVDMSEIPPSFQTLLRVLDKINTQNLFSDDYGYIVESNVVKAIASELEDGNGEVSEDTVELAVMVSNIYQDEYEKVDQKYRNEVHELLSRLLETPNYDESPFNEMKKILTEYKFNVHERTYGWPTKEE